MEQSRQNQMTEEEALRSYRDAFERERQKNRVLSGKLADAEQKEAELGERLGRIKGSVFWRMSKPLRSFVHWVQRTRQRLGTGIRRHNIFYDHIALLLSERSPRSPKAPDIRLQGIAWIEFHITVTVF